LVNHYHQVVINRPHVASMYEGSGENEEAMKIYEIALRMVS